MNAKPRTAKQAAAARDKAIEAAYYRHCAGTQISILDIGKLYAEARAALDLRQPANINAALDAIMPGLVAKYAVYDDGTPKVGG